MRRSVCLLLACATALALAACSNDAEPTSAPPNEEMPSEVASDPPGSERSEPDSDSQRERFIAAADKMCARILDELRRIPQPTDLESAARFTKRANSLNEQMLSRLRALTPPQYSKELSRSYAEAERLIALTSGEVIAALQSGDTGRYQLLALKIERATRKLNGNLRRFGFGACAESS